MYVWKDAPYLTAAVGGTFKDISAWFLSQIENEL